MREQERREEKEKRLTEPREEERTQPKSEASAEVSGDLSSPRPSPVCPCGFEFHILSSPGNLLLPRVTPGVFARFGHGAA